MKILLTAVFCLLISICSSYSAFGQNCTGAVPNGQNLVVNGDFSQKYSGWTHDPLYQVYSPCDGCYSIPGKIYAGANPNDFNGAFSNFSDHSPSSDNAFLMVDGLCQSGVNLWSQSGIPLTPNTNYFFSVWITSLNNASPYGTLQFSINGNPLGTTISAPGVQGAWVKFTAYWNSGANPPASAAISIQNTTTSGCETAVDFAVDDISFSPGCEYGTIGPLPNLGPDFSICYKTVPFDISPHFNAATQASNDVRYTWYKNGIAQDSGLGSAHYNFTITSPGTYAVCVDSLGSCPRTDIIIITPPAVSDAGNDQKICNSNYVKLNGNSVPAGATGTWSLVSGIGQISNIHDSASLVTGIGPGDLVLRWTIFDSPCISSSSNVTIHRDTLSAPSILGASFDTCAFSTNLTYSTTSHLNYQYSWNTTGSLAITSVNGNSIILDMGASGGILTVTDTNGACVLSSSKELSISPNVSPAIAGIDQTPCVDSTFLNATLPLVGKGNWTIYTGTGTFSNPLDPSTMVQDLSFGLNTMIWTVSGCGGPISDTVVINVGISDLVLSNLVGPKDTLCYRIPRRLNAQASGGSLSYNFVWTNSSQTFKAITSTGSINVMPEANFSNYIVYAEDIKNYGCISNKDSVVVHSIAGQNLFMNNLITPNNDEKNDKFIIRDFETYKKILPDGNLEIYNQWGGKVFESKSYDNTWGAEQVKDGIYYYYLKSGCGGEVYKGWVEVVR